MEQIRGQLNVYDGLGRLLDSHQLPRLFSRDNWIDLDVTKALQSTPNDKVIRFFGIQANFNKFRLNSNWNLCRAMLRQVHYLNCPTKQHLSPTFKAHQFRAQKHEGNETQRRQEINENTASTENITTHWVLATALNVDGQSCT